jgi:hypothetical protein
VSILDAWHLIGLNSEAKMFPQVYRIHHQAFSPQWFAKGQQQAAEMLPPLEHSLMGEHPLLGLMAAASTSMFWFSILNQ